MSKKYKLDKTDLKKIGIGLSIALGGAGLTYLSDIILTIDFGAYTPIVVAAFSGLIAAGRKFLQDRK